MGRKRKITLNDLESRILRCKCGRAIEVEDKNVESVTCCLCTLKLKPIPDGYDQDIIGFLKEEEESKKIIKKRGRPKGIKNNKKIKNKLAKSQATKKERKMTNVVNVSSEANESNSVDVVEPKVRKTRQKKEKKEKNTELKGKGKRGRKPTVGAKILDFMKTQGGDVLFNDILNVYTNERKRIGKSSSDDIEKRNCLSTLYIMKRDAKILEVKAKEVYSAIK